MLILVYSLKAILFQFPLWDTYDSETGDVIETIRLSIPFMGYVYREYTTGMGKVLECFQFPLWDTLKFGKPE